MVENGYIFAIDNKRIFINTSLGCSGQCAYCYLPKLGYSNNCVNCNTISSQKIIDFIDNSNIAPNEKTLITLGCYSECWGEQNKKETINLVERFLKKGNQIQLSTKKQILECEIKEIIPLISYYRHLVVFISSSTVSKQSIIEKTLLLY